MDEDQGFEWKDEVTTPEYIEELRKQIFGPEIPRVPDSIIDGSMTLKEFYEWGKTVKDIQMQDDVAIRMWLSPYFRMRFKDSKGEA